jgi:PilZ domain-containing protein
MISIRSYTPSGLKPPNLNVKREQNPRYASHNGLTEKTEAQPATIKNLSRGGFLVETFLKAKLHDAVEFRVEGLTLAGEVIHYHREGDRARIGVRIQPRLDDQQLRKILQPFLRAMKFAGKLKIE